MRLVNVDVVDQVLHEHPAVGDSQSNGSIENGVTTVMGQPRTMRAALERKPACKIPLDHPVMAWMTHRHNCCRGFKWDTMGTRRMRGCVGNRSR